MTVVGQGGAELSGGEQQMLAIARSLLINPRLLVMDEPTEGLAPVIVDHLVQLLNDLAQEDIGLLLIEQNLRVASEVSDSLAIMVNGQIAEHSQSQKMLNDRSMQQRLLGVGGEQGVVTTAATQMIAAQKYFLLISRWKVLSRIQQVVNRQGSFE